jgi:phospholipid/cholesterol/gamma-HCH transport system substrate-binding protein
MRLFAVLGGAVAVVIAAGAWLLLGNQYTVKVALPSATNVIKGGTVQLNGFDVGSVSDIEVAQNQAMLTLKINRDYAPLHEGAKVTVPWKAVLGERLINVSDGPRNNATIPDNGLIMGQMEKPTEVDQVLNALDAPTLDHLKSLVNNLNDTTSGHEGDINATLQAAGPSLKAIGGLLDAVGTDGPAIQQLAVQLNNLTGAFANHQTDVQAIVTQLTALTSQAAGRSQEFRQALSELPPTLRTAKTTLDKVPPVADKTVPLLHDLDPATAKLRDVSHDLRPLLHDLRPATGELRPTLAALSRLLDHTPDFLDSTHGTLPDLTDALDNLSGPLNFLRPYTPEATGWLSNWGSAMAPFDSDGHYARIWVQGGATTPTTINPGFTPPGYRNNPYPLPGQNGGAPWTDAFGSGVR